MPQHYDLKSVKAPYLSGLPLRLFTGLLEGPLRGMVTPNLLKTTGISKLSTQHFDEAPTYQPLHYRGDLAQEAGSVAPDELPQTAPPTRKGFHFPTVLDYAQAYRSGQSDPVEIAKKVLAAIAASNQADPPLRAIIAIDEARVLHQAEQAAARIRQGEALSLFDGVPVAIKDEVDMIGYPTTVGTSFLGGTPSNRDATIVARMRAAGALLIGKANMHEIGIGVTGMNPHHGPTRNPYNPDHYTGGSSSGSATAVAAGLCPVALGADGGGSIRIPAALCGIVGLKATYGRVSEHGAYPLDWSVAHLGPLAASATDAALAYGIIAGPDLHDPISLHQPAPTLAGWDNLDLSDLTLGVYWPWFRHASDEVVAANAALLAAFQQRGATLRDVSIPDLEAGRVAHVITITTEMNQAMDRYYKQHHKDFSLDTRMNLALAREFTARDYVQAQRVRTRLIANFNNALSQVDVILTPSTAIAAPPILATALPAGDSDLSTLTELMRYATPANLTGLPAISFPAGYTAAGLPIGMQAMGRAWQEPTLLRLALAAEQVIERQQPATFFDLLN